MQSVLLFHTHVSYAINMDALKVYGSSRAQAMEEIALVTGARQLKSRLLAFQMSQMDLLHIRCVPEGLKTQHKLQVKNSGYLSLGATLHLVNNYQKEAIKMQ